LGPLLRHARENVPFYERRLDAVMNGRGEIDWDRWTEIPIVTRRDMIDHRDAMQARELPDGQGTVTVVSTSGSTSLPIDITTTSRFVASGTAALWRSQQRNGVDWSQNCARRLGNTTAPLREPFGEFLGRWGPPWIGKRGEFWELNVHLPPAETLAFLKDRNVAYLNTGAAPAHVFALEAERLGIEPPRLDAIIAQGASVGDADRAACKRVFGARMLDAYSSREGGQMAHPCEHGRLHINAELCLLEVVDANGLPVAEGQSGRVVVTPFFSLAQPLIRYEQGDIARPGGLCACGRRGPTLERLEGRNSIFFTHPDGRKATSLLPEHARGVLDCTFWQIAQTGPLEFEVRYVPNDWAKRGDEDQFVRIFRAQYFSDADVHLKRVVEIPLSPSGKFIEYLVETSR
jgi:phenylacetate-CoA ligase